MLYFAEVILPLALPQNFTYRIPPHQLDDIAVGKRVIVQFGKRKLYTALVFEIHQNAPVDFEPKDILEIEDELPVVTRAQLDFWRWMANYYLCSMGEVMTAALPSGLKLESETVVLRNLGKKVDDEELNDHEFLVVEALDQKSELSIGEIADITNLKNPLKIIQLLLGKRYVVLKEEIKGGYKPVQKRLVQLNPKIGLEEVNSLFETLGRAQKQKELLLAYFKLAGNLSDYSTNRDYPSILASKLLKQAEASDSSLKGLDEKEILQISYGQVEKKENAEQPGDLYELNEFQQKAFDELRKQFQQHRVNLLHGVTSSGKTEIYVRFIEEALAKNTQVLYLVPEIALTTQLITRLKKFFGEKVLVYHSRFSDRERVETWLKLIEHPDEPYLLIGARSSLFLPFQNLGFVIVDEEHESSFKQFDPAPRYHARDSAIWLASQFEAKVLLGSATPSVESFYNAQNNKYGLSVIKKRYADLPMPEIQCADLKQARRRKEMSGPFSKVLLDEMREVLKNEKQIILFQNRRGFSTMLQCQNCGHVNQCKNCDITLTYHKKIDLLRCHYCGYSRQIPSRCSACGSYDVKALGFGTEKIEDELKLMLPDASIKRMDLDTTRKKNAYQNIINDFEDGEIDVLIGTQMVTKGLDFENVALVGVLNADSLLHFPDFRSHERAFQLLAQVAGRAGRKGKRGKVLIQTSEPYHSIIRKVMENDYEGMYEDQRYERKNFGYPPFVRLVNLMLKHRDIDRLKESAKHIGLALRAIFGERMLGPEFPLTMRLRNLYQMEIILKFEKKVSLVKAKQLIYDTIEKHMAQHPDHKVQVVYDVDPI